MENFNDYQQSLHEINFKKTNTYKKLKDKYSNIRFEKFLDIFYIEEYRKFTPRQRVLGLPSIVSAVPWYYLDFLDQSKTIYDLGCGCNFFKPYFDNLIGVGPDTDESLIFYDERDFVDDVFYQGHVGYYDSVFSINALHFHPIEDFRSICLNFSNMLKPKGRGFLAMNVQRMLERSQKFKTDDISQIDQWLRTQLLDFPTKILVLDIDLSVVNAWLDGNIRLVFEKQV